MRELRVLFYADGHLDHPNDLDLIFLGWRGAPPDASFSGRDFGNGEVDLGDEDCDDLPSLPAAPGLWLFTWPYEMVPSEWSRTSPFDDEDGADEMTAKYAPTCNWTRPTMAQLQEFGMFPDSASAPEVEHG